MLPPCLSFLCPPVHDGALDFGESWTYQYPLLLVQRREPEWSRDRSPICSGCWGIRAQCRTKIAYVIYYTFAGTATTGKARMTPAWSTAACLTRRVCRGVNPSQFFFQYSFTKKPYLGSNVGSWQLFTALGSSTTTAWLRHPEGGLLTQLDLRELGVPFTVSITQPSALMSSPQGHAEKGMDPSPPTMGVCSSARMYFNTSRETEALTSVLPLMPCTPSPPQLPGQTGYRPTTRTLFFYVGSAQLAFPSFCGGSCLVWT